MGSYIPIGALVKILIFGDIITVTLLRNYKSTNGCINIKGEQMYKVVKVITFKIIEDRSCTAVIEDLKDEITAEKVCGAMNYERGKLTPIP